MRVKEKSHECLQFLGFEVEIARGANASRDGLHASAMQARGMQHPRALQICQRFFDIRPCGVLGEDCADNHFERAMAWPPMLWAKMSVEPHVDFAEPFFHRERL